MIKLLRVDHRLLHGQVAFSWTNALQADCILIANDAIMNDDIKKTAVKLAKPAGIKLVIKNIKDSVEALNSGVTEKYKLFIIVESVKDANEIVSKVKAIKSINLGGTKSAPDKMQISKAIFITNEELNMLKEIESNGIEVEIRQVPGDKKLTIKEINKL
ncbi:PTS sugar transporter subunit IIB [Caldifermentibacillus hisashii]|uniref:PTS sugar transporter subunit IIB n=1 Tax=Caldifermentibacillus hisashii TaxID=996558 RepID=UPI002E06F353|nr:PTS sugar transporter subunit IIB [Caldifermentibacillus hisashii]